MYQALYRKWRPRTFSDVIGQSHITETLQKQVAEGRTSHAYLFTGTRGTGKTTCAKILAKAVNCEAPVNGDPCCRCPACLGIENGNFLDVLELDAASNNGVDQVRALRDEAVYAPANVKKRVYIVDEVHMLSTPAFNALLKILEEPPEHLMFILATTELHKVPATILSRCQRFSFKRIMPRDIAGRLEYVAKQEGIGLTADGAEVRDDRVLSALDREMTALAGESAPEEALCAAWVSFAAGMPARAWAPGSGLEEVAAEDALRTDWYLLSSDPDELAAAGADLVLEMSGRGYTGTLHAGVVSEERLALLQATQPQRADLLEDAGLWVRVKPDEERSREELEADIRADIQD